MSYSYSMITDTILWVGAFLFLLVLWKYVLVGSLIYVQNDQYGILERKWSFTRSEERFGLIALDYNAGFVPEVLRGGWHLRMPGMYRVHKKPLIQVDQFAYIVARIGAPLDEGQILGAWPEGVNIEDARAFLENGGQAGFQRHFLRPGTYAINLALFCIITRSNIFNVADEISSDDKAVQTELIRNSGFDPVVIDNDQIGVVTVHDGPALSHGEIIAPTVGADMRSRQTFHNSFQDIPKFLAAGGLRGRQEQVLVEGTYFINRKFATIEVKPKTKVGIGTVGVVNSYVGPEVNDILTADQGRGRTVERNKRGIWTSPLEPGMYAINPYAAEITHVPTTNFQLRWEEGVVSKLKDARAEANRVSFDDDLKEIPVITKDAFEILLPIAIVAHIKPADAPYIIQRFSQVTRLIYQTLDPMVASIFRNAAQGMSLLDFIKRRADIAQDALDKLKTNLREHRIEIEEVLLGTPREGAGKNNVDRLLEQLRLAELANQQKLTYDAQGQAAEAQKALNEKIAIADQQASLTASEISIRRSENDGKAEAQRMAQSSQAIKTKADADSYAIKTRADAEAHASEVSARAIGGTENLMRQVMADKLSAAIIGSKTKLVPDVVLGAEAGKETSLVEALIAMSLRPAAQNTNQS